VLNSTALELTKMPIYLNLLSLNSLLGYRATTSSANPSTCKKVSEVLLLMTVRSLSYP